MGIISSKRVVKQKDKAQKDGDASLGFSGVNTETSPLLDESKEVIISNDVITSAPITESEKNLHIYKKEKAAAKTSEFKARKESKKLKLRPHYKTSDRHDSDVASFLKKRNPLDKPKMFPIKPEGEDDKLSKHVPVPLLTSTKAPVDHAETTNNEIREQSHAKKLLSPTNQQSDNLNLHDEFKCGDGVPYTMSVGCPKRVLPPRHAKLPPLCVQMDKLPHLELIDAKPRSGTKMGGSIKHRGNMQNTIDELKRVFGEQQKIVETSEDLDGGKLVTSKGTKKGTVAENQASAEVPLDGSTESSAEETFDFFGKVGEHIGDAAMLKLKMYNLELN